MDVDEGALLAEGLAEVRADSTLLGVTDEFRGPQRHLAITGEV
jgi:hypothetical protein